MRQPIRCVVFDFDGTLVDSNSIKRGAYHEVARSLGEVSALVDKVLGTVRGDRAGILREIVWRADERRLLPATRTPGQWLDELIANYTAYCEQRIAVCEAIPGAVQALECLREWRCPLYVNSATPTAPLVKVLQLRNMDHYFDGIYGVPATKVENLQAIKRQSGVGFENMLVVGDGEEDRLAAEKVGCAFFGVTSQGGGFSVPPAAVFPDLFPLADFVMQGATR